MASNDELRLLSIKEMDRRFQRLTGREAFGHISKPAHNVWRVAFGDGTVCTSMKDAQDYMSSLVWLAENNPGALPYPFDQELTPEQDLRVINGWIRVEIPPGGIVSGQHRVQAMMEAAEEDLDE